MKEYHKNPRTITDKNQEKLKIWLEELGDISGIVHNILTDEIIGGNQRSKIFDINNCEIQLTEKYKKPNQQGTIALGYVIWNGNKYNYRRVRWDVEQCEKANIIANSSGGDWDFEILEQFDMSLLADWNLEVKPNIEELEKRKDISDAEFEEEFNKFNNTNAQLPIVPDYFENHECFIIVVHNSIDEQFIRDIFKLNEVHASKNDKKILKTNVIDVENIRKIWISK